jgi:cytochrome oxidase Cu insertion factor (SCO1/SenC/PrrC family)
MKDSMKKLGVGLIVLFASLISIAFSIVTDIGLVRLPTAMSHLIVFISMTLVTYYALSKTKNLLTATNILSIITVAWLLLYLPKAIMSSIDFTLTTIPFFISSLLAVTVGYIWYKRQTFKWSIALGLIPLAFTLGLAGQWSYYITYGEGSGEVEAIAAPQFSMLDKKGNLINNESLKGKVVVMDFWFVNCPTCWVKFPELQEFYEKYQSTDKVHIYAVNRPMKNDKVNQLYTSIENKDYTFPVAKGSEEMMNAFGIDYYPTTVIINAEGEIVFKGAIEWVEDKVKELL